MRTKTGLIAVAAIGAILLGCDKTPAWKKNEFTKREITRAPEDVELPPLLWKRIESVYSGAAVSGDETSSSGAHETHGGESGHGSEAEASGGHSAPAGHEAKAGPAEHAAGGEGGGESGGEGHGGGEGEGVASHFSLPTEFAPIKAYLIEKNRGILGRHHVELSFGPGGGEIDLRDFVENKNGSFRWAVEFVPEAPPEAERKVFFLSNSVRRKRGHEVIGNGCNRYYDVTSAFAHAMKGHGFLVNTTDDRHVSALAGTYFFAVKHEGKLLLAQLTVRDSGQRALQCRR